MSVAVETGREDAADPRSPGVGLGVPPSDACSRERALCHTVLSDLGLVFGDRRAEQLPPLSSRVLDVIGARS